MLALIIALSLVQHPHDEPVMRMQMTDPLGISMERLGSGTTWIPDAVPLPSRHYMAGPWMFMVHGIGFVQYLLVKLDLLGVLEIAVLRRII